MTEQSSKAHALVDLVLEFRGGASLGVEEIARRHGCTKRTAQRYIAEINREFLPLMRYRSLDGRVRYHRQVVGE